MGLFDFLKKKTSSKCVILGLDSSGKSTIVSFIQTGTFVEHTPTMGKSRADIEIDGTRLALFDMGGQEDFRSMWLGEMNNAKLVIFVIDSANAKRFDEARGELMKLIPLIKERKIKLVVMANKRDIQKAVSIPEIITSLNLTQIENFEIMPISAKTGFGLADAFAKIYSEITGKPIKKRDRKSVV